MPANSVPPSNASSCATANQTKIVSGVKYKCQTVQGKLRWVEQKLPQVAPSTKPGTNSVSRKEGASCSKAGATFGGTKSTGLVCFLVSGKLVWVSNKTLDNPKANKPCRTPNRISSAGSKNFICSQTKMGRTWTLLRTIDENPKHSEISLAHGWTNQVGCSIKIYGQVSTNVYALKSPVTNTTWCVAEIGSSGTISLPPNLGPDISRINFVLVGGGGGGGPDGGQGGNGGEVRYSTTPIQFGVEKLRFTIGDGGSGGFWTALAGGKRGGTGQESKVESEKGQLIARAAGGSGGGGWGSNQRNQEQFLGYGLDKFPGGFGGFDPNSGVSACQPIPWTPPARATDGPFVELLPGHSRYFAGGGGAGWAFTPNLRQNFPGTLAGVLGGRGASLTFLSTSSARADAGQPGLSGGGGGGGGSACDVPGGVNTSTQRTPGGKGGAGLGIIAFEAAQATLQTSPILTIRASSGTQPLGQIIVRLPEPYRRANGGDSQIVAEVSATAGNLVGTRQRTAVDGKLIFSDLLLSTTGVQAGTVIKLLVVIEGFETLVVDILAQ